MNNTVSTVIIDIYSLLAALCSFRLLCRRRAILALLYPERVFDFEQDALLIDGRPFPCRLDTPEPGLPRGARPNLRVASFARGSGTGVVVSSTLLDPDKDIVFKRRYSNTCRGHPSDRHLPWCSSNPAGPEVVLRKSFSRSYLLR